MQNLCRPAFEREYFSNCLIKNINCDQGIKLEEENISLGDGFFLHIRARVLGISCKFANHGPCGFQNKNNGDTPDSCATAACFVSSPECIAPSTGPLPHKMGRFFLLSQTKPLDISTTQNTYDNLIT